MSVRRRQVEIQNDVGSAPVVEVRLLDLVAISEAVVKAVKPTKAERYLEEDESQGVESVLLDAE